MTTGTPVSIGICAHNEEETIGTLLDQVMAEPLMVEEVIVVVSGYDRTADIVREKNAEHDDIVLIEEEERGGQSAAQNKILENATADALLLVDGDGTIEPGSLERLVERYDGRSILYGRETPITPDTFTGTVIDAFWDIHDAMGREWPTFTTQIALIPASLVDRIPPTIVIDDEYLGYRARQAGMDIVYVPEAIKYHNIKGDIGSFLRHRRKNWAGMFQMEHLTGEDTLQPTGEKLRFYLRQLFDAPSLSTFFRRTMVGVVEAIAFALGKWDDLRSDYPYIWDR